MMMGAASSESCGRGGEESMREGGWGWGWGGVSARASRQGVTSPWRWGLPAGLESSASGSADRGDCLVVSAPQASKGQVLHTTRPAPVLPLPHLAGVVHDDGVAAAQEDLRGVLQRGGAGRGKGSVPVRGCMGRPAGSGSSSHVQGRPASSLAMARSPCHRSHPHPSLEQPLTSSMARLESATYGTYLITTTWSGCSPGLRADDDRGRVGGCSAGPAMGSEVAQELAMLRLPNACGLGAQDTPCQ